MGWVAVGDTLVSCLDPAPWVGGVVMHPVANVDGEGAVALGNPRGCNWCSEVPDAAFVDGLGSWEQVGAQRAEVEVGCGESEG